MPRKRKNAMPRSTFGQANSRLVFTDLPLADFTVTNEPIFFHSPDVEKLVDEAAPLLRQKNGQAAERLFRQAVALEPNQPDLLNNLAVSLELQDRKRESLALLETLHYLYPDYLFARTGLAGAAMREDDFERAAELLEPLFKRRKFHVSEYDALCATQIDYLLLQNDVSTARVWFKMWEGCNPQNPKLDFYRRLLQR